MANGKQFELLLRLLKQFPVKFAVPLLIILLLGTLLMTFEGCPKQEKKTDQAKELDPKPIATSNSIFFASWNVENFFDDLDDPLNDDSDEDLFGKDPYLFNQKVERMTEVILSMNAGNGPDILVACEVESLRALEALRDKLNQSLSTTGKSSLYQHILFKADKTGRRFAPGIITKLDVIADRTQKLGKAGLTRMLEGHLLANEHELVILAAHFTSRVTDERGDKRTFYADYLYGRYRAILKSNPDADIIVCGDFNDEFKDRSIQDHLRARDDDQAVINSVDPPLMYDLCTRLNGRTQPPGTIYGKGKWSIFDHICISRGLFDGKGWTCDTKQTQIYTIPKMLDKNGRPVRFEAKRTKQTKIDVGAGYSDHLPVITQLRVKELTPIDTK
jgi:endonuclease/exonuclease/phosphatase family metal-dependent hydrolase